MATLDDVRLELQLDSSDLSDASIQYAIDRVGDNFNLVCAYVLQMLINKNRGRTQLTISNFEERIDVKSIRAQIRYYKNRGSSAAFGDIEDSDNVFTMDGI